MRYTQSLATVETCGATYEFEGTMQRLLVLIASCVCATACGTTAPASTPSETDPVAGPVSDEQATDRGRIVPDGDTTMADGAEVIPVAEVPDVPEADYIGEQTDIVCQRIKPTGSHRAIRVCRTRDEIERASLAGKETFDELHRAQRAQPEF